MTGLGDVNMFSAQRGIGEVTMDDGAVVAFHATALTDGTRDVAVGTRVQAVIAATHRGGQHAVEVSPI